MYTANDIRNVRFPKQMNGYKQEEVDIFLDGIESDYQQFDSKLAELSAQITKLKQENEDLRISQSSIQNVLISAQKLADQIVGEAKQKAEEIIVEAKVRANEISDGVEEQIASDKREAEQNKQRADAEYAAVMKMTAEKSQEMIAAAHDSVARQQLLFDKLKLDIVNFKSQIMAIYKEHIDAISKLPDEVPFDSARAAEAAAFAYESKPDFTQRREEPQAETPVAEEMAEDVPAEPLPIDEPAGDPVTEPDVQLGFKITAEPIENSAYETDDDEDDIDDGKHSRGFFKRKR